MERREPFLNSKTLAANEGRLNNSAAQRLAPDHGTSPAPFPFILPLIPTRPRSAPPGSFTTHSLKKGSSFFYTSQRPANLLRFARPRSNDDSNTAYDEAANELMAKPWSCSTFSEGILEQDIPDECKSEPPVRYHQSPESRMKWPHSLDATCMSPSKFPEDKQAPASKDTPAMFVLSMFQNGPDPWSQYSRRDPGTMCALCGHRFTGSSHKVNARRHVRNSHASLQHSFFTARENPLGMSVLKDGKHCHGLGQGVGWPTPESITPSFGIGRLHSATSAKYPDLSLPGSSLQNLATYKSSHIFTVSSPIQASAAASTSNPFSVDFDHQSYVQERMAYLISQLDPRTYPNRVNDFFNGLDIVIGDLRERFPDDLLTLGMQNALVRLENQYLLNCVHNASKTSQSELSSNIDTCAPAIDGEASSSTQPSGASSSTTQKDSTTRPVNGSDAPDQETSTPNRQQDAIQARSGRRKEKKKKNRPLACPIKKHYEAHNQRPLCDFKGGYMSEVAQHLRTRVHRPFLPILTLCRACWAYAISEGEYNNVHRNGHCNQGEQPRKEKAAEIWLDLYRKIYPQSERIPSPYVDDRTWTTVQTAIVF
ncbi:hypothetical protein K505DRAFT_48118 [Melanomma pulvis-pyrius CBS 109.77]|uniref:Uncharacterized protein n=1 Tax=Melanomma pulvis-pyrius CBS 109.77 TaxID=1314802 RepID=A0A6A6X983_9PLEO|nr:hypothetical protein K505DRAFT_48118 [Melanomma pulvis-pyrius CBS 109.77]